MLHLHGGRMHVDQRRGTDAPPHFDKGGDMVTAMLSTVDDLTLGAVRAAGIITAGDRLLWAPEDALLRLCEDDQSVCPLVVEVRDEQEIDLVRRMVEAVKNCSLPA